ncbi:hypothetical protein DFJ77DRAFT_190510 [Powellomyces hirtus]|nr:hypothetical protein DFJ77DRAFT_190510 [Powellomyces hirtus]
MDFSDVPRIRRQLRQLRAKLWIFKEIASEASDSNEGGGTSDTDLYPAVYLVGHSPSTTFLDLRKPAKVTVKYGKRSNARQKQNLEPKSPSLLTAYVSGDMARLPAPVRRQIVAFQDYFKELAEKIWAARSSAKPVGSKNVFDVSNHLDKQSDLAGRRAPSLSQLAAFAVAKNLPLVTPESEEDIDIEEQWYEYIPAEYRRTVLWGHVIELCKAFIPVSKVFVSLTETCLLVDAQLQAWDTLNHFWEMHSAPTMHDMAWSFSASARLQRPTAWVHQIGTGLSVQQCHYIGDPRTTRYLNDSDMDVLTIYGLRLLLLVDEPNPIITPPKTQPWMRKLLRHSCLTCFKPYTCICSATILDLCRRIDTLPVDIPASTRLMLLFRGSQLIGKGTTWGCEMDDDWLRHLRDMSPAESLDEVVLLYPTFKAIRALRQHMLHLEAVPLARKLTLAMMNHFEALQNNNAESGEPAVTIEDLQEELETKKEATTPTLSKLRYEPLIQTWIASTPAQITGSRVPPPSSPASPRRTRQQSRSARSLPTERSFYLDTPRRTSAKPPIIPRPQRKADFHTSPLLLKRMRLGDTPDRSERLTPFAAFNHMKRTNGNDAGKDVHDQKRSRGVPETNRSFIRKASHDENEDITAEAILEMRLAEPLPITEEEDDLLL